MLSVAAMLDCACATKSGIGRGIVQPERPSLSTASCARAARTPVNPGAVQRAGAPRVTMPAPSAVQTMSI